MEEQAGWKAMYSTREPQYVRLREEVVFALENEITRTGIKLHSLTARVKSLKSLEEKAQRKSYRDPLVQAPDVVGVRLVALFLADLPQLTEIVKSVFDVLSVEDRIVGESDPSTFGYMSRHYEARIPSGHTGPRYDDLRDITFEVQVRTILMDAWANVSHYLAYKGESSIPSDLRRDFQALSGLFYVADKHFELFFGKAQAVRAEADELINEHRENVSLSLDSLAAFLETRFPTRDRGTRQDIGELADELLAFGYDTLSKLETMLAEGKTLFEADEEEMGRGEWFSDVGVLRRSLALISPEYQTLLSQKADEADEQFQDYEEL
jgi:putative GTP pyrophosphokinase